MKAPPLPRSARQPQRKMFLAFRICARLIFSKKGKDIFLWGSALQVFGQCGGASIRRISRAEEIRYEKKSINFLRIAVFGSVFQHHPDHTDQLTAQADQGLRFCFTFGYFSFEVRSGRIIARS